MSPRCTAIDASKRYGRHWAVREVTFEVACASIVGLVGANGAGKTTLLRMAAGLLHPSSGSIVANAGSSVAYFGGERTLPPDVTAHRWRWLWNVPEARPLRTRIGALSRGMRQQLGLETVFARTTAARPSLLLLDEPWEGLDPDASAWLSGCLFDLRAAGGSAVVSSHRLHDLASVCDRCLFMNQGRIVGRVEMPATSPVDRSAMLLGAYEKTASSTSRPSSSR